MTTHTPKPNRQTLYVAMALVLGIVLYRSIGEGRRPGPRVRLIDSPEEEE